MTVFSQMGGRKLSSELSNHRTPRLVDLLINGTHDIIIPRFGKTFMKKPCKFNANEINGRHRCVTRRSPPRRCTTSGSCGIGKVRALGWCIEKFSIMGSSKQRYTKGHKKIVIFDASAQRDETQENLKTAISSQNLKDSKVCPKNGLDGRKQNITFKTLF